MTTTRRVHLTGYLTILLAMTAGPALGGGPPASGEAGRYRPDPASVERHGAAYRYPQAGWIVLHIEGEPYERGYQHGRLMAPEIVRFIPELARYRSTRAPTDAWRDLRLIADALFLRRFDPEYLEEMKGIADGAAAAGARFDGRPLDLLDIVTINADIETNFLEDALEATPTGLEGRRFHEPAERGVIRPQEGHCSAFAAVGPATADGQVVIGHITMWNLFHAYHYNVWLDVKPARGHRVLMQTYPGGIMSGLDYYMNDAGLVVCETTIKQTRFEPGVPLADRIRRALQYGASIDDAVRVLRQDNNGLYTNEWLLADTRAGEIAMFELGTHRSRLWRSSRNEWFGGTAGFYWGCNNPRDVEVRLETIPSTSGRPANVVFHPSDRDRTWLGLFDQRGRGIDVEFGFRAFGTPPLAASHSLDAKFTTTSMVKELATWARFGPPMGVTWEPTDFERARFPGIHPLVANDWTVLRAERPWETGPDPSKKAVDLAKVTSGRESGGQLPEPRERTPAWVGTILPASDADTWLAAAFADYEPMVAHESAIAARSRGGRVASRDRELLALGRFGPISRYLAAVARRGGKDQALRETRSDLRSDEWYDIAAGKGVLVLAELRSVMGADAFARFMDEFGRTHAGRPVDSAAFFKAASLALGKPLDELAEVWLGPEPLPRLGSDAQLRQASGRFWSIDSFERQLENCVIVYGTLAEADVQREAAAALQRKLAARWANRLIPVKSDTEVSESTLQGAHVLLVGRPSTNRWTARLAAALPVQFGPVSVRVGDETYANPRTAIVAAGPSTLAAGRSVVVFAGLGSEGTWDGVRRFPDRGGATAEVMIFPPDAPIRRIALPAGKERPGLATADRPASAQ